ncbi:MAG: hypothetical protein IPG92_10960 [Flavobacteriales bacterium]|nr:hypothetical protein [Flavobacteriales bacterium]
MNVGATSRSTHQGPFAHHDKVLKDEVKAMEQEAVWAETDARQNATALMPPVAPDARSTGHGQ